MDKNEKKIIIKYLFLIVFSILLCRVTGGAFAAVLAVAGIWFALTDKLGLALSFYILFPLFVVMNPFLMGKGSILGYSMRFAPLLMGIALMLSATKRTGDNALPLGLMVPFIFVAGISSMNGYCPKVSYLKLINFTIFIVGLWLGTRNIFRRPNDLKTARLFMTAIVFYIIFGSAALLPFPGISNPQIAHQVYLAGGAVSDVAAHMAETRQVSLFAGVTNHSQVLAPLIAICFAWLLCDCLFVRNNIPKIHLIAIGLCPILLFMSRSRLGLLTFICVMWLVLSYGINRIKVSAVVKRRIKRLAFSFVMVVMIVGGISEMSSGTMTRWLRKTNSLETDSRSWDEALTASRMGLVEQSMHDFRRNPMFGSGFQVSEEMQYMHVDGFVLSAVIEKGVLPVMILGETGVAGAITFAIFLIAFYAICMRKRFVTTMILFTVLLVTNFGEATFFSPGGAGGTFMVFGLCGGFVIDSTLINIRRGAFV